MWWEAWVWAWAQAGRRSWLGGCCGRAVGGEMGVRLNQCYIHVECCTENSRRTGHDHGYGRYLTNITEPSTPAQQPLEPSEQHSTLLLCLFLDLARPVAAAGADQHLLGIRGHGATEGLLALDVQAVGRLAAWAGWRGTGVDDGEGRRAEGDGDSGGVGSRAGEGGGLLGDLVEEGLGAAAGVVFEDEHGVGMSWTRMRWRMLDKERWRVLG